MKILMFFYNNKYKGKNIILDMSETSRMRDKFDRFMEMVRNENQKGIKYNPKEESQEPKVIGYFTYDFKNKTETYTPLKEK
jgi:hypothetical protein